MKLQRQHFLLSYLKTLIVFVNVVFVFFCLFVFFSFFFLFHFFFWGGGERSKESFSFFDFSRLSTLQLMYDFDCGASKCRRSNRHSLPVAIFSGDMSIY